MTYQGPDPNQQPAPQPWPQQPQQPPYGTPQPQQQGWAQPQQPQQPYQDPQQQSGAQQWPQQPQPPYGTPQPPQQPPYGTPQPPYDQQQAWPNQQPPFQPPKNNRTGLIVGIAVVVALAIGGGVYALTSSNKNSNNNTATGGSTASPSSAATKAATSGAGSATSSSAAATSGSLTLPTSAGGLSLMSGSVADNVVAAMKKADSSSPIYQNALFGAYSQSGGTYFADLTLVPMSEAGAIATTYQSEGGAATLQSIAQAASLTDTATENSPVSGGSMVCGTLTTASLTLRSCIWIDNDEYGITAMPSSQSNDQAAAYAGALESTSEQ